MNANMPTESTYTVETDELLFRFSETESVLSLHKQNGVVLHAPISGEIRPRDASGVQLVTNGVVLVGASGELQANDNLKFDGTALQYGGVINGNIVPNFQVNAETGSVSAGAITLTGNIVLGDNAISQDASSGLIATIGDVSCRNIEMTSDARMKQYEHLSAAGGLAEVLALRPVEYVWKDDAVGRVHRGFIAQEVEQVLPSAVTRQTGSHFEDQRSMDVLPIVASLVGAVHELSRQVQEPKRPYWRRFRACVSRLLRNVPRHHGR